MEITVKVPDVLAARAVSNGVAPGEFVERLLAKIAEVAQRDLDREKLSQELAADWEQFQSTGLHLDGDEVDAWMAAIERGQNPDLPELHV